MNGSLRIRVAEQQGDSRVVESYASAPFHYLPPSREEGEVPRLTIVNSSGGILGGDALDMSIVLDSHAALALRTQAATKIYRSASGPARSLARFTLGNSALLDYFPDEIIPFAGSDYIQEALVDLAPLATMLLAEIVTAGRLARGEAFAFTRLALDLRCTGGGALLLRDRCDLRPAMQRLGDPAVLGEATIWGSFYLLSAQPLGAPFVEAVDETLRAVAGGVGGATVGPVGLVGRVAGTSLDGIRAALWQVRLLALNEIATARLRPPEK